MIGSGAERRERWLLEVWSRRKWLAIVVFVTTLIAGVTVARYVPSIYEATATVLVEEPQVEATAAGRMDRRLQLITQEIQSRSRLEKLIYAYDLYPHLRNEYPAEVTVARMRRDIRTEFKVPPVAGGPASTLAFTITYRSPKPDAAARVANALAAFYLEEEAKIRGRKSTEAVQVLKEQLEEVSRTLQEQRQKLGTNADDSPAELSQQTAVELAALGRVHADLRSTSDERLRALERRNDLLRRLADAESGGPAASVEPVTRLARLKGELVDLRRRFSDKYPDVVRLQAEIATLEEQGASEKPVPAPVAAAAPSAATGRLKDGLADVDAQIAKLKADEDGLRAEIGAYTQRLDAAPRLRQVQDAASRDYRATRDTYDSLRRRYEQAQLEDLAEGSGSEPQFRILDAAVAPTIPWGGAERTTGHLVPRRRRYCRFCDRAHSGQHPAHRHRERSPGAAPTLLPGPPHGVGGPGARDPDLPQSRSRRGGPRRDPGPGKVLTCPRPPSRLRPGSPRSRPRIPRPPRMGPA